MYNALYGTSYADTHETLADALPGDIEAGSITLELTKQYVDRVVLVSEEAVAGAMRFMVREQGWIAEGGGAVGVAALQSGIVRQNDRPTVVVVSGGNIDADTLAGVLAGA
jgi:threonine dehydratase